MDRGAAASPLTAREREIAALIQRGLRNRQIALELSISERTAGAHVQNILNKLGVNNRAQIAAWSAQAPIDRSTPWGGAAPVRTAAAATAANVTTTVATTPSHRGIRTVSALLAVIGVVVSATDDGARPLAAAPSIAVGDSRTTPATNSLPFTLGALAFEAKLAGDGDGFTTESVFGDPSAAVVRFLKGAVEYRLLKAGGNTNNSLVMSPLSRYYVEIKMAVSPGSRVEFWIHLDSSMSPHIGDHLIQVSTETEELQLAYFVDDQKQFENVGPRVLVDGLQSGRSFTVGALVTPPHYSVYLDGRNVTDVQHTPGTSYHAPSFGIWGDGTGSVRLTSVRVYRVP